MILPWYVYYPLLGINWFDERPRLSKTLLYVTIITLGFLAWWVPAHAATSPGQIASVIAKTKSAGVHRLLPAPLPNDEIFMLDIWEYRPSTCETGNGVNVTAPHDAPSAISLIAFKIVIVSDTPTAIAILDLNNDGIVDQVSNTTVTVQAAQPMFDAIIACIAASQ